MSNENQTAFQRGYNLRGELEDKLPKKEHIQNKKVAVIECVEEIPCNPCGAVCHCGAINKENLCTPGEVDQEKCTGCTRCVAVCPGLSIFLQEIKDGKGYVTLPYELLPSPKKGALANLFNRAGKLVGNGRIVNPTYQAQGDAYPRWVVTVEMDDPGLSYEVRAIKILE